MGILKSDLEYNINPCQMVCKLTQKYFSHILNYADTLRKAYIIPVFWYIGLLQISAVKKLLLISPTKHATISEEDKIQYSWYILFTDFSF